MKVYDFYIDDWYSRTSFERSDFQRIIKDMKKDKIDAIIVKDLSILEKIY